ncbi:AAA family ATPase [Brevibacillus humidisoli]|uniref:AAA family ATPase n=1 Tax=Brevibacillus humidisoli TaxID=2895522 RepID=UPI001E29418C|nr:ATP-binding protein [Brevibacillus humidisoli]UFJ38959.1 AAA family ATPase [Brevibacillus humidisoli]
MSKSAVEKSVPFHSHVPPYTGAWEYISDELQRLDLLFLARMRQQPSNMEQQHSPWRGLVVSEAEVVTLLQERTVDDEDPVAGQLYDEADAWAAYIGSRLAASEQEGIRLPLPDLVRRFRLSSFERHCILLCLAPEVNRKYEKLFAFLQDDITQKKPTIDLTLQLFCKSEEERLTARHAFLDDAALPRYLLEPRGDGEREALLTRPLQLDERIVRLLLYGEYQRIDEKIRSYARLVLPTEEPPSLLYATGLQERLGGYMGSLVPPERSVPIRRSVWLWGPAGSGKKLQVQHLCRKLRRPLLFVNIQQMKQAERPFEELLDRAFREARLLEAMICFTHCQELLGDDEHASSRAHQLNQRLQQYHEPIFLLADRPPGHLFARRSVLEVPLPAPDLEERLLLWRHFGERLPAVEVSDWSGLAAKFRFTPGQIIQALDAAFHLAEWQQPGDGQVDEVLLHQASYTQIEHRLSGKATRIRPVYRWNDVILPPAQKELLRHACNQMKYRRTVLGSWGFSRKLAYGTGLSMLFSGPPGTGKTMSAQVVANELQLELYKIDLSQVFSKYIGETEKNLREIFQEAQGSNAILFFDESDALFGKRSEVKDSHDKYANVETAFLLQKMEEYEGISILATNYLQNIDEAFMRRIQFIIKFPFPDAAQREMIWRSMIPEEAPLSEEVDFRFLANQLPVSGGSIKNIVVSAAFLAAEEKQPISMPHILRACRHEMEKTGKIIPKSELGEYEELWEG